MDPRQPSCNDNRSSDASPGRRALHLCGGLQSSGSTLVSWCFLQRPDMNGVLDADNDILTPLDQSLGCPNAWYKTTISCFRMSELIVHYREDGWDVRPLLVIRDVRKVWASLCRKSYGRNGTTAEDPPLRVRLRRFLEDYDYFRDHRLPILRYESLVAEPEKTLRTVCTQFDLDWTDHMIAWPKRPDQIADTRHGNRTFRDTRGLSLNQTIRCDSPIRADGIGVEDHEWLEDHFHQFNVENNYPTHVEIPRSGQISDRRMVPKFDITRRFKWDLRRKPIRWLVAVMESGIQTLKGTNSTESDEDDSAQNRGPMNRPPASHVSGGQP